MTLCTFGSHIKDSYLKVLQYPAKCYIRYSIFRCIYVVYVSLSISLMKFSNWQGNICRSVENLLVATLSKVGKLWNQLGKTTQSDALHAIASELSQITPYFCPSPFEHFSTELLESNFHDCSVYVIAVI